MTYNMLMGTLNPTHSLTHSLTHSGSPPRRSVKFVDFRLGSRPRESLIRVILKRRWNGAVPNVLHIYLQSHFGLKTYILIVRYLLSFSFFYAAR